MPWKKMLTPAEQISFCRPAPVSWGLNKSRRLSSHSSDALEEEGEEEEEETKAEFVFDLQCSIANFIHVSSNTISTKHLCLSDFTQSYCSTRHVTLCHVSWPLVEVWWYTLLSRITGHKNEQIQMTINENCIVCEIITHNNHFQNNQ